MAPAGPCWGAPAAPDCVGSCQPRAEPPWLAGLLPQDLWVRVVQQAARQLPDDLCDDPQWADDQMPFMRHDSRLRLLVQLSTVCRTLRDAAEAASTGAFASAELLVQNSLAPRHLSPLLARLCRGFVHVDLGIAMLDRPQAAPFLAAAGIRVLHVDCCGRPRDLSGVFAALCSCPQLEELQLTFFDEPVPLPASLRCPPGLQRLQLCFPWETSGPEPAELGLLGTAAAARLSIGLLITEDLRLLDAVPCTCQLDQLWFRAEYLSDSEQCALSNISSRRCRVSSPAGCDLWGLPRTSHLALEMAEGTVSWPLLAGTARCLACHGHAPFWWWRAARAAPPSTRSPGPSLCAR